jgi:hypothetical protein
LVQGKPAKELFVYFRPVDETDPHPIIAFGQVDEKGRFTLSTYVADDGAPAGDYAVTFEWPLQGGPTKEDFQGPDRLKGRWPPLNREASINVPFGPRFRKDPRIRLGKWPHF